MGYLVALVRQESSTQPDAWAVHQEADVPLAIEIETTTYSKPSKLQTNLKWAHAEGAIPVFIVPPGDGCEEETAIARRGAKILDDPVKRRDSDGVILFMDTDHITFNGGAKGDDGVTAVRPATEDAETWSNHTPARGSASIR